MPRQIDIDAEIDSIRMKEQAGDPATPDAGYFHPYFKAGGMYWVDDAGVVAGPLGANFAPTGRLTLTTATPVTTADVTAAATLYYTPYNGNVITLYDGARWIPVIYTEKSLSLAALTASKPYDIWGYLSSGTLALEALVWTNATTRATALAYQDGRLVKTGAATRLYLGSIYINSSGGQTDDSVLKRNVFNYYNGVERYWYKTEATNHTYNSTTIRYWNNDSTQFVEFMLGVAEKPLNTKIWAYTSPTNAASPTRVLLTADGATSLDATNYPYTINADTTGNVTQADYRYTYSSVGWHTIGMMEQITAGSTNGTFVQVQMSGHIMG